MALNTLGIKFNYLAVVDDQIEGHLSFATIKAAMEAAGLTVETATNHIQIPDCQEIGELAISSDASGGYDQIEITTLADVKHQYMNGLMADSGNATSDLAVKFLYDPAIFEMFKKAIDAEATDADDIYNKWVVVIPEGGSFTIKGKIGSIKMDSIGTNSALTMTLTISVQDIDMSK